MVAITFKNGLHTHSKASMLAPTLTLTLGVKTSFSQDSSTHLNAKQLGPLGLFKLRYYICTRVHAHSVQEIGVWILGVLVFLNFGHFSCELKETVISGATKSEIWIGNFNVKARKTTKHKLHKIWRSLKFYKISRKQAHPFGFAYLETLLNFTGITKSSVVTCHYVSAMVVWFHPSRYKNSLKWLPA